MNIQSVDGAQAKTTGLPPLHEAVGVRPRPEKLVEDFIAMFAPGATANDLAYGRRSYAVLEGGESGSGWRRLDRPSARRLVALHLEAGERGGPVPLFDDGTMLRAVGLSHRCDDRIGFVNIDLDGHRQGYEPARIVDRLARLFGPSSILVISGSGRAGKYRVLARLKETTRADEAGLMLARVFAGLHWPAKNGGVEIYPSTRNGRLPFGCGGCATFALENGRLHEAGEESPADLIARVASLEPVDLPAIAEMFPPLRKRFRRPRYEGDPATRVERPRARPREVRILRSKGVTGWGQRYALAVALARDGLYSGRTEADTTEWIRGLARNGWFAKSHDVERNGLDWWLGEIPRVVREVYAYTPSLGVPDPIPLSEAEYRRARAIAEQAVADGAPFRVEVLVSFMLEHLPHFKAAEWYGLDMLRRHSDLWRAGFGRQYARIRDACGIFEARTGYKPMHLTKGKGNANEAYARSWVANFPFDEPTVVVESASEPEEQSDALPNLLEKSSDVPSAMVGEGSVCDVSESPRLYVVQKERKTTGTDRERNRKRTTRLWRWARKPMWQPDPELWMNAEGSSLERFLALHEEHDREIRKRGREKAARTRARNKTRRVAAGPILRPACPGAP